MQARDRIIVAVDVNNLRKAGRLIRMLTPFVGFFKFGLEICTWVGVPQVVKYAHQLGARGQVFLDGKFDDIPNTVAGASKAVANREVAMFNVHASAGRKAIEAAVANKGVARVLGVTVLTSIDETECVSIFGTKPGPKVLGFSETLLEAGADGIICSPQELTLLGKYSEFNKLLKVTPGVRPVWASVGDQKRVMTPGEAMAAGATHLVIGRPITQPPKEVGTPVDAAKRIAEEIQSALAAKL